MKTSSFLLSLLLVLALLQACQSGQPAPEDQGGSQDHPDLVAIDSTIHSFYSWYDAFQRDSTRSIIFTNDEGEHLRLDSARLEQYFANLRAGGFLSESFFAHERELLKKCEALWQNELKGDVPSCVDSDRFFCAQDWDMSFWTSAPVSVEGLGTDQAKAVLAGEEGGVAHEQRFELARENGKWMITRILCDFGVGE